MLALSSGGRSGYAAEIENALIVFTADSARMEGATLTLDGVSKNAIVFVDRRAVGHTSVLNLLKQWPPDSPCPCPQATIAVLSDDGNSDEASGALFLRKIDGRRVTFEIKGGSLAGSRGAATVFIDGPIDENILPLIYWPSQFRPTR
jgi:hypothetical protein